MIDYAAIIASAAALLGAGAMWLKADVEAKRLRNKHEADAQNLLIEQRKSELNIIARQKETELKVDSVRIQVDGRLSQLIAALTAKGVSDLELARLQAYSEGLAQSQSLLADKNATIADIAAGIAKGISGQKG